MAERDIMSVAITFDADGAIKKAQVLDTKFKSLGASMQKGQARTEGLEAAQKKLSTALQGSIKSSTDENVKTIAKLQVMEAATSGLNQLISAQYKRIDADLAAGKITAEEAEERRKAIKQQEKYTGILESAIAISRLYTVAQVVGAAVTAKLTTATNVNTAAVAANNAVVKASPWFKFLTIGLAIVGVLMAMEAKFNGVTRGIQRLNKELEKIIDAFNTFKKLDDIDLAGFGGRNRRGTGEPSFVNQSRELGFGGGRSV